MQSPPTDAAAKLDWLIDRAAISDVMAEYTRCLDTKDFPGQASLLAEDGRVELPFDTFGRTELPETAARHLGAFGGLQHQISNPLIDLDGDAASLRCNFEAVHVHGEPGEMGGADHETVGGVYEVTLRREQGDWKLVVVKTTFLWVSGPRTVGTGATHGQLVNRHSSHSGPGTVARTP